MDLIKTMPINQSLDVMQRVRVSSTLLMIIGYFFLPLFAWTAFVAVLTAIMKIESRFLLFLCIFCFSMLIASRHIGYLYDKSDDLPSYFLAYEAYGNFLSVIPLTVLYARNGDIGFAYLSYFIKAVTDEHLFLYFFSILFLSLAAYSKFAKKFVGVGNVIFCLLVYLMFFKAFQMQWMIIRSCLAIPFLLLSLHYVGHRQKSKGYMLFLLGFLMHGATAVLFFPALLYGENLSDKLDLRKLFRYIGYGIVFGVTVTIILVLSNSYVITKILSQDIALNLDNAIVYIVPLIIGLLTLLQCRNHFLKNVIVYFLFIGAIGFMFGKNFYRFVHPLLFLLPIMIVYLAEELREKTVLAELIRPGYALLCYLSFLYVMQLDEPNFYYKQDLIEPVNVSGYQQAILFDKYVTEDIIYYKGWRER